LERTAAAHEDSSSAPHSTLVGLAGYMCEFEEGAPPPRGPPPPTRGERLEARRSARVAAATQALAASTAAWKPKEDPSIKGNALATLFVARLPKATTERQLANVFKEFGEIRDMRIVKDKQGKSRGYAFLEFEDEADVRVRGGHGICVDWRALTTFSGLFPFPLFSPPPSPPLYIYITHHPNTHAPRSVTPHHPTRPPTAAARA
jgi:hypothetical protein